MNLSENFIIRKIASNFIAVPINEGAKKIKGIITLNETAAFLWEGLSKGFTEEELVQSLLEEYEVDEERATNAVNSFIKLLREEEVL